MKKKIAAGFLVFLFFIAMVTLVIIKDAENRKSVDEITGNTIRNALESDSGMSMDEIAEMGSMFKIIKYAFYFGFLKGLKAKKGGAE